MMAQEVNTEVIGKLNSVIDLFRDGTFPKMKEGMQSARDCAAEAGSQKLVRSCDAAVEGTDVMIKMLDSLIDCCEHYRNQLQKMEDAMN